MIRLIASDMDGTLLDAEKRFPPDFFDVLGELGERGVVFAVCSGRPYSTLGPMFAPAPVQPAFICDNGAFVVEHGRRSFVSIIDRALVREVLAYIDSLDAEIYAVVCGLKGTYLRCDASQGRRDTLHIDTLYNERGTEIDDDIFKIAVCDPRGVGSATYPALCDRFGGRLTVVHSGPLYADLMNPGIDKGAALAHLQKELGISPDETMAFGDYYNDAGFLARASYSFVMENADEAMRKYANFTAPPNTQYGVIRTIRRYVLEGETLPLLPDECI